MTTEGHTVVDAFLTVSAAQIGQVPGPRFCARITGRSSDICHTARQRAAAALRFRPGQAVSSAAERPCVFT